ncbi:MAG: hypothetical protein AB8B91_01575 [Rubripirellula sp.]
MHTSPLLNRCVFLIAWMLAPSAAILPAIAQEASPNPTATEVVQRAAEKAGSKDAFSKIKTIVLRGTFSIPQAKRTGTILTQYAAPDRARVTIDLGQVGKIDQGITPTAAWEISPSTGQRILGKDEAKRLLESISMRTAFEPEKVYDWMSNQGLQTIDGQACYHLQMKRSTEKDPDNIFYSVASGLPVKTITSRSTPNGSARIDSQVSDYKEFDGIKIATKITQVVQSLGTTYEIRIQSMKINSAIADSVFEAPKSVQVQSR